MGFGGAAGSAPLGGTTGASTDPVPLQISPRDAVTRVARVLWESPPDQALVEMADSGSITTDADVRRLALRMLSDSRARVGVAHFYRWWLNLDALATTTKRIRLCSPNILRRSARRWRPRRRLSRSM